VIAARKPGTDLRGLPGLVVEGLLDAEARQLLMLAEARGNPLALRELSGDG
jgi:hypothetical protein